MRKINLFYILCFIGLLAQQTFAQVQQLKFNRIKGADGITLGKINCIIRDKNGFIWLSDESNGCIIRYDGTHMIKFGYDAKNPNSLGGTYPECMFQDSSGIIWIGFYGMGLDRFDPVKNTFTHYRHDKNDPESLGDDLVSAVRVDHLGNVWVGSAKGLDLLDQNSGKFKHFRNDLKNNKSLSYDNVRAIYEDREGTLWIGTGFPFTDDKLGGLNKFNRKSSDFTRYLNDPKNPKSIANNKVRSIFEDSKGNFWIGTAGDGLHLMNRKTGEFERLSYDAKKPDKLSRPPTKSIADHITFITEDINGSIWIGTLQNGVCRYDTSSKKIKQYINYSNVGTSFPESTSWWACSTPEGQVWISTQSQHLYKVELFNIFFPHFELENKARVNCILEDADSIFWFGTNKGLVKKDFKTNKTEIFINDPKNPSSISGDCVNSIIKDHEGYIWIGTNNGLDRFDIKTKIFSSYFKPQTKNLFGDNAIGVIFEDSDFNLWVGIYSYGLNLFDRATGKFTPCLSNLTKKDRDEYVIVIRILEDRNHNLWILYFAKDGVILYDKKTKSTKSYLRGNVGSNDIFLDKEGIIWACSAQGVLRFDKKIDDFVQIDTENSNLYINKADNLLPDNDKNLWIIARDGIFKINRKSDFIVHYGEDNGLGNGESFRCFFKSKNNQFFIGDEKGYFAFYPENIKSSKDSSKIFCTNFWLNGELQKPSINGVLKASILDTKEIKLNHSQNSFSLSFTVLDFRNTGQQKIYYTLENYDKEWRETKSEEKVYYFKVTSGKYNFKIKTANANSGIVSEKNIEIVISPPWWSTWWAYILFATLFVGSIWGFVQYQSRKIISENKKLEHKVLVRTTEVLKQKEEISEKSVQLEKSLNTLKATQAQLIQSEKLASLGELTAGIAHEIQNPLNFVNNFAKLSVDLAKDINSEIHQSNIDKDYVEELLTSLSSNQDKISYHGNRAATIVKGMIEHSKPNTGVRELTDINKLCDEYSRLSFNGLKAKNADLKVELITHFDESLPHIEIVPQDIGRVIVNLVNNAFYAVNERNNLVGFENQPSVTISTQKTDNAIEIRIKDNGTGMTDAVREKVFQPFFTTKPTGSGTGLGLSLAYDIITKGHGGSLKVESTEGVGSEFFIILPFQK